MSAPPTLPLRVRFVTGNAKKLEVRGRRAGAQALALSLCPPTPRPGRAWQEVVAILGTQHAHRFVLDSVALDLPELQGDPLAVAAAKAREAARRVGGPVVVEDTSLCFNALGGLPGVYIKDFLRLCGHDGLNRLLAGFDDKTAYAQCVFAYAESADSEPLLFVGRTPGRVAPAAGDNNFGWDPIFVPDEGAGLSYAQMAKERKNEISHRFRALDKLRDHLLLQTRAVKPAAAVGAA